MISKLYLKRRRESTRAKRTLDLCAPVFKRKVSKLEKPVAFTLQHQKLAKSSKDQFLKYKVYFLSTLEVLFTPSSFFPQFLRGFADFW